MTGFGQASEQVDGVHYTVEVRSLNNRYFKSSIRLPEQISGLDAEIDTLLRRRIARGSVTLVVKMSQLPDSAAQQINVKALHNYVEQITAFRTDESNQTGSSFAPLDLTAMLCLPGVLTQDNHTMNLLDTVRPTLLRMTDTACDQLAQMRKSEGQRLIEEFVEHSKVIHLRLTEIIERAPVVVEEYHGRLRTRIDELIKRAELTIAQADLTREVAIFAERADIREETSRLSGHLEQLDELIRSEDPKPVGRTLDFIAQELLREANTIASKSNDAIISKAIVVVKSAIDRIKEQAQNVE